MEKVIVDVLGNFGEYKGLIIPTTSRAMDLKHIVEAFTLEKFGDIPVAFKVVADIVYRKKGQNGNE